MPNNYDSNTMGKLLGSQAVNPSSNHEALGSLLYRSTHEQAQVPRGTTERVWTSRAHKVSLDLNTHRARISVRLPADERESPSLEQLAHLCMEAILNDLEENQP